MKTNSSSLLPRLRRGALVLAFGVLAGALASPALAQEMPTVAITPADAAAPLAPGQFEWIDATPGPGPMVIVVSLPEQMAHVYRGGVRIARTTISSGREGHETPPGVYEVLEKQRMHHSNKYNDAPMPFMQRLTWDGIALHAGKLPGYPASHGCIRLPLVFAQQLYDATERGITVVVADETTHGPSVLHPGATLPVDPYTGYEPGVHHVDATASTAATTPSEAAPSIGGGSGGAGTGAALANN